MLKKSTCPRFELLTVPPFAMNVPLAAVELSKN
jgi:hypothetical protein